MAERRSGELVTLHAVRALAALSVLLFHSEVVTLLLHSGSWAAHAFDFGFVGVDVFFVLSGFLMVWVHARDFGRAERLPQYLARRFGRIYPFYWALCLVLVPVTLLMPAMRQNATGTTPVAVAWSILLLPHAGGRLLGVTWTLEYELLFYTAFGMFLLSRRAGLAMFAGWLAVVGAAAIWGPAASLPTGAPRFGHLLAGFVLNLHVAEFGLGMLVAYAVRRGVRVRRAEWLLGGVLAAGAGLAFVCRGAGLEQGQRAVTAVAGALSAAMLFAVVQVEMGRRIALPRWLRALGEASYAIYLTHFLAISALVVVAKHTGLLARLPVPVLLAEIVGLGLLPGLLLHMTVERRLLAWTARHLAAKLGVANASREQAVRLG